MKRYRFGPRPRRRPWRLACRAAFILFAGSLLVTLHWPGLEVGAPGHRTDLWVHVGSFALLTLLLCLSGWFGEAGGRRNLALSAVLGVAAGAALEYTQRTRWVNRHFAIDDLLANTTGAGVGIAAALVLLWLFGGRGGG